MFKFRHSCCFELVTVYDHQMHPRSMLLSYSCCMPLGGNISVEKWCSEKLLLIYWSLSLHFRSNRNERLTQIELHDNSGWDECDVSKRRTLWKCWAELRILILILFLIRSKLPLLWRKLMRLTIVCVHFWRMHGPSNPLRSPVKLNSVLSLHFRLLILTLMNLGLFFKLWAMEDVAHRMYLTTKHRLRERAEARSDNFLFFRSMLI